MQSNLSHLGLAVILACTGLQAQAIGRLADITVIDRNSGANLPLHYSQGEYWVAGAPGARYAVSIRNKLGERIMAVTSVDGINVVSGATAAWGQAGYVLGAYYDYQVTGWRKSNAEVAAFEFSTAGDSYAGRTGRPNQVGVIGVAVFKERLPEPAALPWQSSRRHERDANDSRADMPPASPPQAGPAPITAQKSPGGAAAPATEAMADRSRSDNSVAQASSRPPLPSPKLGTGHGQREDSQVGQTSFERVQLQPNEIITIRYDSRENLIAAGVIREPAAHKPTPFPLSNNASFVPDPPPRRF